MKIKPSKNKRNKIDVYDLEDNFLNSIGQYGANDYAVYLELEKNGRYEKGYADKRRELYWQRHKKDISDNPFSKGMLSLFLLW